jgi:hypothetical protein
MSIWGRIFGTDKALQSVVNSVSNGIDALVYTDEEKANDAAKDRTEARGMVVRWMEATQGQNLARRLIALSITGVWLLQFILSQVFSFVAIWVDESIKWQVSSVQMQHGADTMNGAVMLILAFYFAAPHMGDIAKAVTSKFAKSV